MRFRAVGIIMAGAMCFMTSACVGSRPIHYYTINHPAVSAPAARPDGSVLVIGRITTPEPLQDGRIRYRTGSNEVGAYEYHRWTERPAAIVQDLLIETLRASGHFRQVLEGSTSAFGDYLIRGRLLEFAEIDDADIRSRVSLRLEMVDRKNGAVVWEHNYNRDEPVDGKTVKEVVLSIEHNLQEVIAEAALAIEASASHQRSQNSGSTVPLLSGLRRVSSQDLRICRNRSSGFGCGEQRRGRHDRPCSTAVIYGTCGSP